MGDFIVSARKYRPRRFDEVVGQEHVSQTLKNALKSEQLAHAFLFCGPRGVGKTTCARILAKVINCQNKTADFEPCGECSSCTAFQNNASFNISELDAASNNSVENIRSLVEQVRIPPQSGKYKVFIIDEVHMLSQSAFNAFLKTLEEPPPYAIFILATTEKHKILPTILSRCQIYDFKRISIKDIADHLSNIANQEQIEAENLALHVIAEKADGALRDALSLFDRLASGTEGKLTYQAVIKQLNILDYDIYLQVIDAMLMQDGALVLNVFDDVVKRGFEPNVFMLGLAEHVRNLLVAKDQKTIHLLEISDDLKDRYIDQAYLCSKSFLVSALDLLNQCDVHYKMAANKRLHLEIHLIKLTYIQKVIKANPLVENGGQKKNDLDQIPTKGQQEERQKEEPEKKINPPHKQEEEAKPSDLPEERTDEKTNTPSSEETDKTVPTPKSPKKKSLIIGPALKNTEDIVKAVEEEAAEQAEKENLLNLDNLLQVWQEYADDTPSPSLKNVMESASITCQDNTVTVLVGTLVGKNMIKQESDLSSFIREKLNADDMSLIVEVDPSMVPEDTGPVKPQTIAQKYDFLVQKNPLVKKLVEEFKLKPEE